MNREKGNQKLNDIIGPKAQNILEGMAKTAPAFTDYIIEHVYGDLYARPTLSDKTKELATVACLIGAGNNGMALKVHLEAMMHVGWSATELKELLIFLTTYAGYPACLNAVNFLAQIEAEEGN